MIQETKFPRKQQITKINQVNNVPGDFSAQIDNQSDPLISKIYGKSQKRTLYIYEINRLFKNNNNENNKLSFSANTVKIGFIDIENVLITEAAEVSDFTMQLAQRASANTSSNSISYSMTDIKQLIFQQVSLLDQFKLYAVSINEPVNNESINNLYIINTYNEPYRNPKVTTDKAVMITKIQDFKSNDGYPIIIKLQKSLPAETEITGIKITAPRSILFGNIKVIGQVDDMEVFPKLKISDDKILFPLLSMPIETEPKVRILQQWMTDFVMPWEIAKQFIKQKSVLELIKVGSVTPQVRQTTVPKSRISETVKVKLSKDLSHFQTYPGICVPEPKVTENINIVGFKINEDSQCTRKWAFDKPDNFDNTVLDVQDAPEITSLQKVLLDMLTYTYTFNRNFDGFDPNVLTSDIAKLRSKFESQKPVDVISNLVKQWELDNPNYTNITEMLRLKQIISMISKFIYSKFSINNGMDDDYKLLLPYYFELKSSPTHTSCDKVWEFTDCEVILKSEYFDFSDPNNIKLKNQDISQNQFFKLDDNQFSWLSITNQLETNNIPSLLPSDISLANGEYGKYFTILIISNNNTEQALKLYGSGRTKLFSKLEFYKAIEEIEKTCEFEQVLENPIKNLNRLEISGIFAAGNYDIILITKNKQILLENINLFNYINEKISYINIEI